MGRQERGDRIFAKLMNEKPPYKPPTPETAAGGIAVTTTEVCARCGSTEFGYFAGPTGKKTRCRKCGLSVETRREQAMTMSQELADAIKPQREHMVALLSGYVEARTDETNAKQRKDLIGNLLKSYLEEHPEEVIYDGEAGIEASMKERSLPGKQYDLITLAKKDQLLFQRLLETGCLQVNAAAVKVQGAQVGGVEAYAFPQGKTTALSVEVKK